MTGDYQHLVTDTLTILECMLGVDMSVPSPGGGGQVVAPSLQLMRHNVCILMVSVWTRT